MKEIVLFFAIWVFVGSWCNARLKVPSLVAFIEPKYLIKVNEHKTHQKCRHIVEVESKERISTVSPLIPSPPIWPTNWPSTTCGQSLKVSLRLKRQSYWGQIHSGTRPEISSETDTETFFRLNIFDPDTEAFFWDQLFSTPIPRLFFRPNFSQLGLFSRLNFLRPRQRLFRNQIFRD